MLECLNIWSRVNEETRQQTPLVLKSGDFHNAQENSSEAENAFPKSYSRVPVQRTGIFRGVLRQTHSLPTARFYNEAGGFALPAFRTSRFSEFSRSRQRGSSWIAWATLTVDWAAGSWAVWSQRASP